jgi:hypothetical protein
MRLSSLSFATLLLIPSLMLAQHSSGGGSGGSSGGGSSGGGSHSSSSGGSSSSSSSGSSHSSGGGSGSHGSASHGSSSAMFSRSGERTSASNEAHLHQPSAVSQARTVQPEKRSFFSFLRHPFHKPEPKHFVYGLRRPVCPNGHCSVCPGGQVRMGNTCIGGVVPRYTNNYCSREEIWRGGSCLLNTNFLADCSGLLLALQRQEQRVQAAESVRQSACMNGGAPECSGATRERESEENLYQSLEMRYRRCQASAGNAYFLGGHTSSARPSSLWIDPSRADLAP